jgi:hypothetical protein
MSVGKVLKEEMNSQVLRTVPREKAFYFFTSLGNYTGESAASLKEFMDKINKVNVKSLEFHLLRGDFQKWMTEVLEDKKLALDFRKLQTSALPIESIRNQLFLTVSVRYRELAGKQSVSPRRELTSSETHE